jgi:thioredoxin reductase
MYEALWTNGPKEAIEFFDYHFNEHFDHPLPVYMPRQPILEYMIGRVTKNCPHFFDTYMKFNTSVEFVRYVNDKFEVTTLDMETGKEVTQKFDKCIWAGGENGRKKIPQAMLDMFQQGGFRGKIMHSSDTGDFERDVKGKRVLFIGGGYSAEDLALMAVKCGVEKLYVSSRDNENVVTWTGAWPQNKVEVLKCLTPIDLTEGGNCIQFAKTYWEWPNKYLPYNKVEMEIRDIDTIIMCTGYEPNFHMLDNDLRLAVEQDPEYKVNVPNDWRMKPNKMTEIMGEVEAGDCRYINSVVGYYGLYRGMSIDNPNMMFIVTSVDNPLFGIDVDCWLLLRFITGMNTIPSAEEMKRQNEADAIRHMENSYLRYCMDYNYCKAWNTAAAKDAETREELYKLYYAAKSDHYEIYYRTLARSIEEAEYPVSYGSYESLNETVQTLIEYGNNADEFRSVFTGEKSIPLKQKWLDIDANDATILEP